MADSIVRLKVESQEYTQKLKRATSELQNMEAACRTVGGTMAIAEKKDIQFAQSLGQMQTQARNAKGKIAELNNAFTEASLVYKRLTDEEKASPFGKALSSSIDQLKGRLNDAKTELASVTDETQKSSGALEGLASKLGINVGLFNKATAAAAAAAGAYEVAKASIESLEVTHDEFARTMQACDSVTNAFLTSLASADFSNFISGLQGVIDKAKDAYNALDDFESYAVRFDPKSRVLEGDISTKLQQARAAKAQGDIKKAQLLTKQANDEIKQLQQTTAAYGKKQATAGYAEIRSQIASTTNGRVNLTDKQINYYTDPSNWDIITKKAARYQQLSHDAKADLIGGVKSAGATEEARRRGDAARAALAKDGSYYRAWAYVNTRDSGNSEAAQRFQQAHTNIYGNQLAEQRIASLQARADRMDGVVSRSSGGSGGGGRGGSGGGHNNVTPAAEGSIDWYNQEISKLNKELTAATDQEVRVNVQNLIDQYTQAIKQIKEEIKLEQFHSRFNTDNAKQSDLSWLAQNGNGQMASIGSVANSAFSTKLNIDPNKFQKYIDSLKKGGKETANAWESASNAVGSLGSALQQIKDPTVKVAGIIAEAIANIALTFSKSLKGTVTPWDWIAAAASGTATMISTIAAIKSATSGSYATGGLIPGNGMSGDNMIANVNSGELILNRAQQGNIASQLQGSGFGQMQLSATIKGEDIRLALNNNSRRRGRGEYVTSR